MAGFTLNSHLSTNSNLPVSPTLLTNLLVHVQRTGRLGQQYQTVPLWLKVWEHHASFVFYKCDGGKPDEYILGLHWTLTGQGKLEDMRSLYIIPSRTQSQIKEDCRRVPSKQPKRGEASPSLD